MELFTLNRYDETVLPFDPEKEDNALQKLIKKAEKRKRILEKSRKEKKPLYSFTEKLTKDVSIGNFEDKVKKMKTVKEQINVETESDSHILNQQNKELNVESSHLKVLGDNIFQKKQKVDMVLPSWLADPLVIANKITEADGINTIETLKFLSPQIKKALRDLKIEKLFPIQNAVIPWILSAHSKPSAFRRRDICVSAPTGSGKTLAFVIPIVQLLSQRVECKIRALVVLPINELALQVYRVFKSVISKTNLSACLLSKSLPLAVEQQNLVEYVNDNYYSKVDIVVTTPGRLVEHMHSTKGFDLTNLKFLIIDEADRIMEQTYHNWLYHLNNCIRDASNILLPAKTFHLCLNNLRNVAHQQPHKLLFSATLSQDPEKLQNLHLFQPKLFTSIVASPEELLNKLRENQKLLDESRNIGNEVRGEFIGKYTTPAELTEKYCITESHLKPLTLYSLIVENSWKKFLCFTNNAETAHRLTFVLTELFKDKNLIKEISGNLKPQERTKILNLFSVGAIKGLISSDTLARGIDIPKVDIVISYELPRHIKTYIHRMGRTARAGQPGTAITLLSGKELPTFNKILSEAGKMKINEIKVTTDIEVENAQQYSHILEQLKVMLEQEKKIKAIYKDAATKKAIPSKTTATSIMERLQIQANELVANKLETQMKQQIRFRKKMKKLKSAGYLE